MTLRRCPGHTQSARFHRYVSMVDTKLKLKLNWREEYQHTLALRPLLGYQLAAPPLPMDTDRGLAAWC